MVLPKKYELKENYKHYNEIRNTISDEAYLRFVWNKCNITEFPCSAGKTTAAVRDWSYRIYDDYGVRIVVFVAPRTELISDSQIRKHHDNLRSKLVKDFGIVSELLHNPKPKDLKKNLNRAVKNNHHLFVTLTDCSFNSRVDTIVEFLKQNTKEKCFCIFDEVHISPDSKEENYEQNHGQTPSNIKCVKFSSISKLMRLDGRVCITGLTATPVWEMEYENHYNLIKIPIEPSKLCKLVAPVNYNIFDNNRQQSVTMLNNHFNNVIDTRKRINIKAKEYGDTYRKPAGLCFLNVTSRDKNKFDYDDLINYMNENEFNRDLDCHVVVDVSEDSSRNKKPIVWKLNNGKAKKMTKDEMETYGYDDTDGILDSIKDPQSKLMFLFCIDKGTVGLDVNNFSHLLVLRTPNNKYKGKPVVYRGVQTLGRLMRLQLDISDLLENCTFNSQSDLIEYYLSVNTCSATVPNDMYWHKVIENQKKNYPSLDMIRKDLSNSLIQQ